jgi:hypothetical protein
MNPDDYDDREDDDNAPIAGLVNAAMMTAAVILLIAMLWAVLS